LLTVSGKPEQVRKLVDAFHRGGGEGKPLLMQVGLNWARDEDEAFKVPLSSGATMSWEAR